jgi:hypothetical protein
MLILCSKALKISTKMPINNLTREPFLVKSMSDSKGDFKMAYPSIPGGGKEN